MRQGINSMTLTGTITGLRSKQPENYGNLVAMALLEFDAKRHGAIQIYTTGAEAAALTALGEGAGVIARGRLMIDSATSTLEIFAYSVKPIESEVAAPRDEDFRSGVFASSMKSRMTF